MNSANLSKRKKARVAGPGKPEGEGEDCQNDWQMQPHEGLVTHGHEFRLKAFQKSQE